MTDQSNELRKILNKIKMNNHWMKQYDSKWHSIVNFLFNNTGLSIAKVAEAGSLAKGTGHRKSDLDVIFALGGLFKVKQSLDILFRKAYNNYKNVAKVGKGEKAIHIDFLSPKCDIDVVPLTIQEFDREHRGINAIKQINQLQKDAIILSKYSLNKIGYNISGYQVEKKCLQVGCNTLDNCVYNILSSLTGLRKNSTLEFFK